MPSKNYEENQRLALERQQLEATAPELVNEIAG
jgi:hypothetical protein